jgi:hypothetical protein
MEKIVPLFKPLTTIFYLKKFEQEKVLFLIGQSLKEFKI